MVLKREEKKAQVSSPCFAYIKQTSLGGEGREREGRSAFFPFFLSFFLSFFEKKTRTDSV